VNGWRDQFTQEDPAGLAGGANLYGYAGGDPANSSDPFGLCDKAPCPMDHLIAGVIAGAKAQGRAILKAVGDFSEGLQKDVEGLAGRVSVYAHGGVGPVNVSAESDMMGRVAARGSLDLSSESHSASVGVAVDLMEPLPGSHPMSGSFPFGVGSAAMDVSVGKDGIEITKIAFELGVGGAPAKPSASAQVPGSPTPCVGSGCKPWDASLETEQAINS
jgi:hypothetical protein